MSMSIRYKMDICHGGIIWMVFHISRNDCISHGSRRDRISDSRVIGVSSNGRTADFDSAYRGSNPCTPANLTY